MSDFDSESNDESDNFNDEYYDLNDSGNSSDDFNKTDFDNLEIADDLINNGGYETAATNIKTSITASNLNKYYYESGTLYAYLKNSNGKAISGKSLTFKINGASYSKTTNANGRAGLAIELYPGTYTTTISFSASGYVASKKTVTVTVKEMPTSITANDLTKYYSENGIFKAYVKDRNNNPVTGRNLVININGKDYTNKTDKNGCFELPINLQPKTYTTTVSFNVKGFTASKKTATVTVNEMPTSITANDLTKYYSENGIFKAYLKDRNNKAIVNKDLTININGKDYINKTDSNGCVELPINLKPNVYTTTVSFTAKGFTSSTKTAKVTVNQMPATITANDLTFQYTNGGNILKAYLKNKNSKALANKILQFSINNKKYNVTTDSNGCASLTINDEPGTYSTAINFINTNYATPTKTVTVTVKAMPTSITANDLTFTYNNNGGTLNAYLKDNLGNAMASKTLTFNFDGKNYNAVTDSNGKATVTLKAIPNTYETTITYAGTNYYASSTKKITTKINKISTTIESGNLNKYYSESNSLTATLKDANANVLSGKSITININTKDYTYNTDSNGKVSLPINLPVKDYTTKITFNGDSIYSSSTKTVTVSVKEMPTTIVASDLTKYYSQTSELTVYLKDRNGKAIPNQNIVININNKDYTNTTDSAGCVKLPINLFPKDYTTKISFQAKGFTSSSKTITVTVKEMPTSITANDLTFTYGKQATLNAYLKDVNNNPINAKSLKFSINNVNTNITTNNNGLASLKINNNPGTYKATISFNLKGYVSSAKTVTVKVNNIPTTITANNLDMKYGENKILYAYLKDGDGKSLNNEILKFNFNNKDYEIKTDANGRAGLNINANPGNYTVTISFTKNNYVTSQKKVTVNIIGNIYPTVNIKGGYYDKNNITVNLNINDAKTYSYNWDNTAWIDSTKSLTFTLDNGEHNLYYRANGKNFHETYVVDNKYPSAWSNYATDLYNSEITVNLTSWDAVDKNPVIYYTLDGSNPLTNGIVYNNPFKISSTKTLKFYTKDATGHKSNITTNYYLYSKVANLNNGKEFNTIQSAIDDSNTKNGDVISVNNRVFTESVNINKAVTILTKKSAAVKALNYGTAFNVKSNNVTVDGFKIIESQNGINANGYSNCIIENNQFNKVGTSIILKNTKNIIIYNNEIIPKDKYTTNNNIIYNPIGIIIENSKNLTIQNNKIDFTSSVTSNGQTMAGIRFDDSNSQGAIFANNIIGYLNRGTGISAYGELNIENNTIQNYATGIYSNLANSNINQNNITKNNIGLRINSQNINYYSNNIVNNKMLL